MQSENQSQTEELNLDKLEAARLRWKRTTTWLVLGFVLSVAGLAWGIRDWISPVVGTNDAWTLPVSLLFFVEMAGLLAFSLQEWVKANRRIKGRYSDSSSSE